MNRIAVIAFGLLLTTNGASAETLYKLIHKDGKVTYSETPPEKFDGKVIRMDIDPNANTATLPKPAAVPAGSQKAGPGAPKGVEAKSRVQTARENLEKAQKNLQDAKDSPGPEDLLVVSVAGGGGAGARKGGMHSTARPGGMHGTNAQQSPPPPSLAAPLGTRTVPSDAYIARLNALEEAVKRAEEDLRRAEDGK